MLGIIMYYNISTMFTYGHFKGQVSIKLLFLEKIS